MENFKDEHLNQIGYIRNNYEKLLVDVSKSVYESCLKIPASPAVSEDQAIEIAAKASVLAAKHLLLELDKELGEKG